MSTITDLREQLMQTLADLRNGENPMDVDRARAVAQVANVLVDTAKVQVDYIKATGAAGDSLFISSLNNNPTRLLSGGESKATIERTPNGFVHRMKG